MGPEIKAMFKFLTESQIRTQQLVADLAVKLDGYVTAADARMTRIETNLDLLIRSITLEHANGKG